MTLRNLAGVAVVAALLITGCGKKNEEAADAEFADIPSLEETSTSEADSSDIFDEFYEDEGTTAAQAEPVTEPEPVEETYGSSSYVPEFADDGRYVVQVSCVASPRLGTDVAEKLRARGYPAYVAEVQNPTPELIGTYHRVRIGSFHTVSAARNFGNNVLVPAGYEFWVDNKSNDNVGMDGYGLGEPAASSGYESSYQASTEPAAAPAQSSSSSSWEQSTTTSSTADDQWGEPSTAGTETQTGTAGSGSDLGTAESSAETGTAEASGTAEQTTAGGQTDDWGSTTTTAPAGTESAGTEPTGGTEATQEHSGSTEGTEQSGSGDGWGDEDWGDDW